MAESRGALGRNPIDRAAIAIVRTTFESLAGREPALADRALLRLFGAHPRARRCFGRDLSKPKRHLIRVLSAVATHMDDLRTLEPALAEAGIRHARYGALPEHYAPARVAVLDALADLLGTTWTPVVKRAWTEALEAASGIMLRAALRAKAA